MKRAYNYQTEVVETIFDNHGCLVFTVYDETQKDSEGYNPLLLICQIPNMEQIVLSDTEENREYCINHIDWYLLQD